MFKNYKVTLGNNSNSYQFEYELEQHRPAQEWANLMQSVTVDSLRLGLNPWQGLKKSTVETVNRLTELIELINEWLPESDCVLNCWDDADPTNSLNKLHVHFPHIEKNETDRTRLSQLTEYNDTIHCLEDIIRGGGWLLILPDRNTEVSLIDDDFRHFHPHRFFGELCLHYPHIGKHPLELLKSKDFNCPVDQIFTQKLITSYHSLRFHEDATTEQYMQRLNEFYKISTLNQAYSINDPKLAFGYITLGKLTTVNGKSLPKEEVLAVVKNTDTILTWDIS